MDKKISKLFFAIALNLHYLCNRIIKKAVSD